MNKMKHRHHLFHNNASLVLCLIPLPSQRFLWQAPPGWTGDPSKTFHTPSTFFIIAVTTRHCTSWLTAFLPKPSLRDREPHLLVHSSLKHKRRLLHTPWLDGWTNTDKNFLKAVQCQEASESDRCGSHHSIVFSPPLWEQNSLPRPQSAIRSGSPLPLQPHHATSILSLAPRFQPQWPLSGSDKPSCCLPAQLFPQHLPEGLSVILSISAYTSPTQRGPS